MPESARRLRLTLTTAAQIDIREALIWTRKRFGEQAAARYRLLLIPALHDISADPELAGSRERSELAPGIRTYHLFFSRNRTRGDLSSVRNPRHFVVYRRGDEFIEVIRVLHDARDLERHLPEESLGGPDFDLGNI